MTTGATTLSKHGDSPGARRGVDWPALAGAGALSALAILAYGRTFAVPFLYDDGPSIADNPTIRHLGSAFWPPVGGETVSGRPILNLSLAINYAISGTAVWSYHAVNLAIHVLAGLTLFGIARRTLAPRAGAAAISAAFSIALLWVLHPLQTESVTYVVQRAESLMGLFFLLTLYCLIRSAEPDGPGRRPWQGLCIAACLLGMGTKEVMAAAPLVALLFDRTFLSGSFREAWRRRRGLYVGLAATWLPLALLVLSTHGRGGSAGLASGVSPWGYAMTQLQAIVHYLRLCFWPHPLIFDYGGALVTPSPRLLPYALAVAGLLAVAAWSLFRRPALGFLAASFFLILAPSSSLVPVATETMAEQRMYLPLIPVIVLVVIGIFRWLGRAALPLCLALAAGLFGATWQRNEVYRSDESVWGDTVANRPGNERAHNNLGDDLQKDPGRMNDAIVQYREAIRLKPDYPDAHNDLGCALETFPGRLNDAISEYEEALRLKPEFAEAHFNLGNALVKVPGRLDEAIAQYEEALRIKPDYPKARYNLGCALSSVPGRLPEAIAQYGEALRLDPDYADARGNLGNALFIQGRKPEAITQYEEALRIRPDDAEMHGNLGYALSSLGRTPEAIAQYEEALRIRPDDARIHLKLAVALLKDPGRTNEAVAHLREALRLEPGNDAARQILERIAPLQQ